MPHWHGTFKTWAGRIHDTERHCFYKVAEWISHIKPDKHSHFDKMLQVYGLHFREDHPLYPNYVHHVYAQSKGVGYQNSKMVNDLDEKLYPCRAHGSVRDTQTHLV